MALTREQRGWVEAGTVLYFEQQPNKSHIPRLGEYFVSYEVVKAEAYDALVAQLRDVANERNQALDEAKALRAQLATQAQRIAALEGALKHIQEYWNGSYNERAMTDYCNMARDTSEAALTGTP